MYDISFMTIFSQVAFQKSHTHGRPHFLREKKQRHIFKYTKSAPNNFYMFIPNFNYLRLPESVKSNCKDIKV